MELGDNGVRPHIMQRVSDLPWVGKIDSGALANEVGSIVKHRNVLTVVELSVPNSVRAKPTHVTPTPPFFSAFSAHPRFTLTSPILTSILVRALWQYDCCGLRMKYIYEV